MIWSDTSIFVWIGVIGFAGCATICMDNIIDRNVIEAIIFGIIAILSAVGVILQ